VVETSGSNAEHDGAKLDAFLEDALGCGSLASLIQHLLFMMLCPCSQRSSPAICEGSACRHCYCSIFSCHRIAYFRLASKPIFRICITLTLIMLLP